MKVPDYFAKMPHLINVLVVGAGGTGSLLLTHLARINKTLWSQGRKGLMVTSMDEDKVEAPNLGRSGFSEPDIGRYKAVVLVERINLFYGTSWGAIAENFSAESVRLEMVPGNILISCTDTVASRAAISRFLKDDTLKRRREEYDNHYWIDTGNGRYTGQVILGSVLHGIPSVMEEHPDIARQERRSSAPSCSLAEAVAEQDLFINPMVALVAAELVWNITQQRELVWTRAYINLKRMVPVRYKHH